MPLIEFSAERPFGVELYPIFDKGFQLVTGKSTSEWAFTEGVTPFSTYTEVILSCIIYYAVIFGGQHALKYLPTYKPSSLKFPFQVHNLLLTIASGSLLALLVEQVFPKVYNNGLMFAICSPDAWDYKVEILYYLNYLCKYWELLDTVFLVLKHKKLEFLHYYHHSMTMALCFTQLVGKTSVSWVPIILNLSVHVLMYYYYFRTASGAKIWWKKYLTTLQITQFIIDLVAVYFCTYTYYAFTYFPFMPNKGSCTGEAVAAFFGCGLLSSYLVLFVKFYNNTYKKARSLKRE
ncbi:ELO family [Cunninghamella echinulata]|nr:ELO family [Cunninghamella echinulata]